MSLSKYLNEFTTANILDLCNPQKYFIINNGITTPSNRLPRSTEDIKNDKKFNQSQKIVLPNTCNLNTFASLSFQFTSPPNKTNVLYITSNMPADPNNERSANQTESIKKDSLRQAHGWYTANPKYKINSLSSNTIIMLNNMSFNNKETFTPFLYSVNQTIIAGSIINTDNMVCSDSKSYDSQFLIKNKFSAQNYICDNMKFTFSEGFVDTSKFLDSKLEYDNYHSNNNKYWRSSINPMSNTNTIFEFFSTNDEFHTVNFASPKNPSINLYNPTLIKCNINLDHIIIDAGNALDNTKINIKTGTITNNFTLNNSTLSIDSGNTINITNNNSIVNLKTFNKLIINNNGKVEITENFGNTQGSIINNNISGLLIIKSGYLNFGYNNGIIQGDLLAYQDGFINMNKIVSKDCFLLKQALNIGHIVNGIFFDQSVNKGLVNQAIFKDQSINDSIYTRNHPNICIEPQSLLFGDRSINKSELFCANGSYKFTDFAKSIGSYIYSANFFKFSELAGNNLEIETISFFDNSLCSATNVNINNQISFHDFSTNIGSLTTGNMIIFNDNSFNSGLISNITAYFKDSSYNIGSGSKHILHFQSETYNSGYVETGYFYAGSSNLGVVKSGIFHPSVTATGIVEFYSTDSNLMDD